MASDRVPLEGSRTARTEESPGRADPAPSTPVDVTILVRRRAGADERIEKILRGEVPLVSREQGAAEMGADADDLALVARFAAEYGLRVVESSPARRSVRVSGTVAGMEAAFGIKLWYSGANGLWYEGALTIPAELAGIVVAVLGLDQRPVARRPKPGP